MIILLKSEYFLKNTGVIGYPNYVSARRFYEFNTATLSVAVREVVPDPSGENYSRPTDEIFHTVPITGGLRNYYHNGNGGFITRSTSAPVTARAGCTDPSASNYDPAANVDNGTCVYSPADFVCQLVEVMPCEARGVFLRWKNRLGGTEGWLFTGQVDTPNASAAIGEYANYSGLPGAAQKTADRGMLLRTSGLTLNRWEALCEIFTSPLVWLHHADGSTEQVYAKPAANTYSKNKKELEVEVSRVPFNSLTR